MRSVDGSTRGEHCSDLEALSASVASKWGSLARLVEWVEQRTIIAVVGAVEVIRSGLVLLGERLVREHEESAAIDEDRRGALQKCPAYEAADLGDDAVLRLLVAAAEQPSVLGVVDADERAP